MAEKGKTVASGVDEGEQELHTLIAQIEAQDDEA